MTFLNKAALTFTIFLLTSGMLFAQVQQQQPQMPDLPTSSDVSDEEIELIATTIGELEPIQVKAQEKIGAALEEEGISMERFQQMMMAMQNPQMADQVEISDEEMATIQSMQPTLMQIQGEAEQEMSAKMEENGITMQRYRMVVMGAQQDPDLMERLQSKLEEGSSEE
jgi:ribosomal protein S13